MVADDRNRENEADLFVAASMTNAHHVAFMLEHTSGFVCVATTPEVCDTLQLPPMVADNKEAHRTAFTVTVDASTGVTTGISAGDRAATIAVIGSPDATAADLVRPGHIPVLRAEQRGLAERRGHTEAAVYMARLAGVHPAVAICELVTDDKLEMRRGEDNVAFARNHDFPFVTVAELASHAAALDLRPVAGHGHAAGTHVMTR